MELARELREVDFELASGRRHYFCVRLWRRLIGGALRTVLPEEHLSMDARDVVKLEIALIATMAARVLNLSIASANSTCRRGPGNMQRSDGQQLGRYETEQ